MSYETWRYDFLVIFKKEFPDADEGDAGKLIRLANKCQKWNEKVCSIPMGEVEQLKEEDRDGLRIIQAKLIIDRLGGVLKDNGDPRGFPFQIIPPSGKDYDFGGGFGVPGKGYSIDELNSLIFQAEQYQRRIDRGEI